MNPLLASLPAAFAEQFYLKANPDVSEAVAKGDFSSGHDHWLLHGQREGRSMGWTKADLTNHLADVRSYRSYLEICTPTTGCYAKVDRSKYEICHRLMYRCPDGFDDGIGIDFRSPDLEIADCIKLVRDLRYDVILVDSFHTYEISLRDLTFALDLLTDRGTIVIHDCDPPNEEAASPHFSATCWAGVTYKAYLDFVMERDDLEYFTIDTDWGCGVIRKKTPIIKRAASEGDRLAKEWRRLGDDPQSAFGFFQANKASLLKLVTVQEFLYAERILQLMNLINTRDEALRQKEEEIAQLNSHVAAMLESKSWKVTAPLRAIRRILRR